MGGNVGRLTSIGTLGSLAGTLLIGYLLIPHLPNSLTMYFTALALMLVCAGYFLFAAPQGSGNRGPAAGSWLRASAGRVTWTPRTIIFLSLSYSEATRTSACSRLWTIRTAATGCT